jgi:hypothetical protein
MVKSAVAIFIAIALAADDRGRSSMRQEGADNHNAKTVPLSRMVDRHKRPAMQARLTAKSRVVSPQIIAFVGLEPSSPGGSRLPQGLP